MHVYIYIYIHITVRMHLYICIHTYICTDTQVGCMYVHIYIHVYRCMTYSVDTLLPRGCRSSQRSAVAVKPPLSAADVRRRRGFWPPRGRETRDTGSQYEEPLGLPFSHLDQTQTPWRIQKGDPPILGSNTFMV